MASPDKRRDAQVVNNYALCLLFLEDESEKVLFQAKWETNSKFFKVYCSMLSMNRPLLLYFGKLREYLFEVIESLLNSEADELQAFKLSKASDEAVFNETLKKVDDAFIQNLAKQLLFSVLNNLPKFSLIEPFFSALNKDIYKRLKAFLKQKYRKANLSDFLKQKLKHFVVNLFLTFFFDTLTSQEEFGDTGALTRRSGGQASLQGQVPARGAHFLAESAQQGRLHEHQHGGHRLRKNLQQNLPAAHRRPVAPLFPGAGFAQAELRRLVPPRRPARVG